MHTDARPLDVAFSDGRFLRRVVQEAQRGSASGDEAARRRLEAHGFGAEHARIALTVAGGDERKALEMCMAGLAFTGADNPAEGICAPPALRCYICGGQHLTQKSLDFHTKACQRRFELRQARRPAAVRRPLLDKADLPQGVDCLERYYELLDANQSGPPPPPADVGSVRGTDSPDLQPCLFCARTFTADRLQKHQRVCMERPRVADTPPAPVRRRCSTTASTPAAAVKAYDTFKQQLERCTTCGRQFRSDILQAHLKQCRPVASPARPAASRPQNPGAAFVPPPRRSAPAPASVANAVVTAQTQRRRLSSASEQPVADEESLCAEALLARGDLTHASDVDDARLRAELETSLPNAEYLGAYQVKKGAQQGIYEAMKASLLEERPEGSDSLERELWHGTSWAIVVKIIRQGFNRSFAGRHGTLLGVATYFSADVAYSSRFCDRRGGGRDATKVLLVARVLVGNYCKGSATDIEPPVADDATGARFDSTVDSEERPNIFAVFRDFQATPLYLVEFRS